MELNDTPSKRSNSDEEMVGKEYKVERLKRLTCKAKPIGRGKGLKWQGDNNMGNNDNSVVTEREARMTLNYNPSLHLLIITP
jgi:hypothetical protein